jgi:hypothetical protein
MSITRTGAEFVHAGPLPGQRTLAVGRGPRQPATLVLLAFAMLVVSLDQYIVVVALPEIGRDLGYSAHTLQSVISAYAVASAGFLLLGGRAADLLGRRRVFVSGLALTRAARSPAGSRPVRSSCSSPAPSRGRSRPTNHPPPTATTLQMKLASSLNNRGTKEP